MHADIQNQDRLFLANDSHATTSHSVKIVAIIPARGGSKGIPRKNLRPLAGRPLIAHTIDAARLSSAVTRVVVSTDDAEISTVATACGADVIDRPSELAGDTTSSEAVLLHAVQVLTEQGESPDILVFLQCTSPMTTAEDIDGTVAALLEHKADSAFTAVPFHHFLWRVEGDRAVGLNHDHSVRLRRQDREPELLETGAVYAMRTGGFLSARHRFFGRIVPHVVGADRALEIDTPDDLVLAEATMRVRQFTRRGAQLVDAVQGIVFDFDGVFTDNHVLILESGQEAVVCDRGDGLIVERLRQSNLRSLVLSRETNPVGALRCAKLGLDYLGGVRDKRTALLGWIDRNHLDAGRVVYVGNDVNDLECMQAVGCAVAVADAYPSVKDAAKVVLSRPGGHGAVREIIEMVLAQRGG